MLKSTNTRNATWEKSRPTPSSREEATDTTRLKSTPTSTYSCTPRLTTAARLSTNSGNFIYKFSYFFRLPLLCTIDFFSSPHSFSMFYSTPPYTDLIFQDAATQLKAIEPKNREYSAYLGPDFMRAKRVVDCYAGTSTTKASLTLVISSAVAFLIRLRS